MTWGLFVVADYRYRVYYIEYMPITSWIYSVIASVAEDSSVFTQWIQPNDVSDILSWIEWENGKANMLSVLPLTDSIYSYDIWRKKILQLWELYPNTLNLIHGKHSVHRVSRFHRSNFFFSFPAARPSVWVVVPQQEAIMTWPPASSLIEKHRPSIDSNI